MTQKKTENHKDNYLLLFITISIVLLIVSFVFPFVVNNYFSDWSKSGTFGDTFGALNSLFSGLAFAGVIITILIQRSELKNQRIELQLQRNEMRETRNEFLINRTTNLVYHQLDRFEKSISELSFEHAGKTYQGNDAISFLDEKIEIIIKPDDKSDEEYNAEMKESTIKQLKFYNSIKTPIEKFSHTAYNSVEVLKRLVDKTKLDVEQLNELKNLFFINIGFINMGVFKHIVNVTANEFEYLTAEDLVEHELSPGVLLRSELFLKSIVDFYEIRLTKENFEEKKAEWLEKVGKKNV